MHGKQRYTRIPENKGEKQESKSQRASFQPEGKQTMGKVNYSKPRMLLNLWHNRISSLLSFCPSSELEVVRRTKGPTFWSLASFNPAPSTSFWQQALMSLNPATALDELCVQQKPRCITLFGGSRAQKYCLSFLQQDNWKKGKESLWQPFDVMEKHLQ